MREWRIHHTVDHLHRFDFLFVSREVSDTEFELIVGFENGTPVVERFPHDVVSDFHGLALPYGVLDAIAEYMKPGPSQGELRRLEDALTVERGRVDAILARTGMLS